MLEPFSHDKWAKSGDTRVVYDVRPVLEVGGTGEAAGGLPPPQESLGARTWGYKSPPIAGNPPTASSPEPRYRQELL